MRVANFVLALFLLITASVARAATDEPFKVTVTDLFKHPKKYDGKRVEVTGYWVTSCAHCSDLYPSFEVEQRKPYGMYVALGDLRSAKMPAWFRRHLLTSWGDYDGCVRVIGRFKFAPIPDWVGKPVSPQPTPEPSVRRKPSSGEEDVKRVIVWGWNGPPVKQIVDITEFHPVGPPIPSRIQDYDWRQMGLEPPSDTPKSHR